MLSKPVDKESRNWRLQFNTTIL